MSTDEPRPEGLDGEAPGRPLPDEAPTTWHPQPPTEPVPPAPTVVPDADTTRIGQPPTTVDPAVPPPPAPVEPGWSAPTPAPGWSSPAPPAPPAYGAPPTPPPAYGAPPTPPPAYGAPVPPAPAYGAPPPVAPGWSAPPGSPGGPPMAPVYVPGQQLPGVAGWGAVPQAPKPGVIPLRPLGVGEILDGAISYMRRDPKTVLGISAVIASIIALLQLAMFASFGNLVDRLLSDPAFTSPSSGAQLDTDGLAAALGGVGGVALLVTVVSFLLGVLATGLLTAAMGRAVLGRPVSTRDVWDRARRRFWPLLGLTLLVGLVVGLVAVGGVAVAVLLGAAVGQAEVGLGVLLGVVLGIAALLATVWLTVKLLLAPVALILEDVGVTTAMARSFRLVKGAWWRTFGIYLLATILAYIVAQVLTLPFSFVGGLIGGTQASSGAVANPFTFTTSLAGALGTLVSQTVVIPFTAGIVALLYIDRRIRREALDIELARAAGVPGA